MSADIATTKEYLKMIFKNEGVDMITFIVGLIILSITNPGLFPLDLLQLIVQIGIIISFTSIIIRISLSIFRNTYLHIGETRAKYKAQDWTITKSIKDTIKDKIAPEVEKKEDDSKINTSEPIY